MIHTDLDIHRMNSAHVSMCISTGIGRWTSTRMAPTTKLLQPQPMQPMQSVPATVVGRCWKRIVFLSFFFGGGGAFLLRCAIWLYRNSTWWKIFNSYLGTNMIPSNKFSLFLHIYFLLPSPKGHLILFLSKLGLLVDFRLLNLDSDSLAPGILVYQHGNFR